jgi:hypothetical protein
MVASGSTNVASGSEDALPKDGLPEDGLPGDGLPNSTSVGASDSGGGFELELSPLAGAPTPPCMEAFARSRGSNRGFRSCIYRPGVEGRVKRPALRFTGTIAKSIYPEGGPCTKETAIQIWAPGAADLFACSFLHTLPTAFSPNKRVYFTGENGDILPCGTPSTVRKYSPWKKIWAQRISRTGLLLCR